MDQLNLFELTKPKFEHKGKLKIGTFFSGIGSPEKALKNLGIDYELMFFSEIDKYAIESYCAIHNEDISKNKGDIKKIKGNILPYCDLWVGGFPCQDISLAGKQKGWESKTRSSLGWEMIRLVREVKEKPKIIIFENVKNITSEKFIPTLHLFKKDLESLGYSLYDKILNAKDYEIPQNRERYFLVAILGNYYYEFPKPIELKLRLKDMLEDEVDEKYYLSDKMIAYLNGAGKVGNYNRDSAYRPLTKDSPYAWTINTCPGQRPTDNFIQIPEATKKGYALASDGDGVYINRPHQKRGCVQKDMIQTIKTQPDDIGVVLIYKGEELQVRQYYEDIYVDDKNRAFIKSEDTFFRIRKLTPLECYRLMGFSDEDFYKAKYDKDSVKALHIIKTCLLPRKKIIFISKLKENMSNSQLYRQAGNSICVPTLEHIFKNLIKESE